MASKPTGPEINVNSGRISELSSQLQDIAKRIADLQTQEEDLKKGIKDEARALREAQADKDNFISNIRVTGSDEATLLVQFRMSGLALPVDEDLSCFEGSESSLFEKKRTLKKKKKGEVLVKDSELLIQDIQRAGLSLNDVIEVCVKNEDALMGLNSLAIEKIEALVPVKDFLSTVNSMAKRLTKAAKDFIRVCLTDTLNPAIITGNKGKGE